jgi:hypothetical protein
MTPLGRSARIAGLLSLTLFGAPLRLIYIPGTLFVQGDATATASHIAAHELLFRVGIVGDLLTGVFSIFLLLAVYRLFKGVDQGSRGRPRLAGPPRSVLDLILESARTQAL